MMDFRSWGTWFRREEEMSNGGGRYVDYGMPCHIIQRIQAGALSQLFSLSFKILFFSV